MTGEEEIDYRQLKKLDLPPKPFEVSSLDLGRGKCRLIFTESDEIAKIYETTGLL